MNRRNLQGGFTLTELMVTVAIIGVLAVLGTSLLRGNPQAIDSAAEVSSRLAEASRKAVAGGPVRGAVAEALATGAARTRTRLSVAATGVTVTVQRLVEDAEPGTGGTWETLTQTALNRNTRVDGYSPAADLSGGATAPAVPLANGSSLEVLFNADGTANGTTIYLSSGNGRRKARVVVLPLGGTPMTFDRW